MSKSQDVLSLLAILQKHNLVLPDNREALEKDLDLFLMLQAQDAYDLGLDRGWEMAQMTGDY